MLVAFWHLRGDCAQKWSVAVIHHFGFFSYLNQKVLGLGSPLAISHQLLLTFPVGEAHSSQSETPSHRDESLLHGNTTSRGSGLITKHRARVTGWKLHFPRQSKLNKHGSKKQICIFLISGEHIHNNLPWYFVTSVLNCYKEPDSSWERGFSDNTTSCQYPRLKMEDSPGRTFP